MSVDFRKFGNPINIMEQIDTGLQYDKVSLNEIFCHDEVKDREIVVFSIVGAFRQGKSYFMDYCLRFMYGNVRNLMLSLTSIFEYDYNS